MKNSLIEQLLNKYLLETITGEETRQFFALLDDPDCRAFVMECIGEDLEEGVFEDREDPQLASRIKRRLAVRMESDRRSRTVRLPGYRRFVAAAAAILVISIGMGIWWKSQRPETSLAGRQQVAKKQDIPPGKAGAILTLADGTKIDLDSTGNGSVLQQGKMKITKLNGMLSYHGVANDQTEMMYNTITVPPAHQVELALSDGSRVWLNASSTLRFPSSFTGGERVVELTGEGYFEVAHKAGQPFAVKVAGMQVQDIGTQFDIMAYTDEPAIRTTVVEGSARVVNGGRSVVLRPNDQADVTKDNIAVRQNADVEEAVAWKNGVFLFKGTDLAYMLRQLGRWYNIAIVFPNEMPKGHIEADIPRTMNLSKTLEVLHQLGISCKLEGDKLIIAG
jgi:ferric-dicitrate binding protein FerR (iron transport regulator)